MYDTRHVLRVAVTRRGVVLLTVRLKILLFLEFPLIAVCAGRVVSHTAVYRVTVGHQDFLFLHCSAGSEESSLSAEPK